MNNRGKLLLGLLLAGGIPVALADDNFADQLSAAVTGGKAGVDFRYRFEGVDQDGISKNAKASTLRSRLWAESASLYGFTAFGEVDNVAVVGDDDYNSTENGKTRYPVVADPKGTEVNQAYLKYTMDSANGIYGRQRINYSNQRFVGAVAWRQNEQTFDGFRGNWQILDNVNIDYSYAYRVHRVFGPDDGANPAEWSGDNNFLYVDWKVAEGHQIGAFAYYVDVDDRNSYPSGKTINNSSESAGLEYIGNIRGLRLRAAYARQSDAGDSELDYDADYYLAEVGGDLGPVSLTGGYEVLAAGDGVGFATPLATLHKFQGWADKFLSTPADGVEDLYLGVAGKVGPIKLEAVYHDFQAEDSSQDYGTELDLVATWPVNKLFTTQLKYAAFDADNSNSGFTDTDKVWFTLQLKI